MANLFCCSLMLISCLILVSASVIPNHINNIGLNHVINPTPASSQPISTEPTTAQGKLDHCLAKCKEDKVGLPFNDRIMCKYNCEHRFYKRLDESAFLQCMAGCHQMASAVGGTQNVEVCNCRQNCDKTYPKLLIPS